MAKLNTRKTSNKRTHAGARAKQITPEQELRRSVLACLLFENQFYENGVSIAERILDLSSKVDAKKVSDLAIEAREQMNLRHAPLLLVASLAKNHRGDSLVRKTVTRVIKRADELTEVLAIHAAINNVTASELKKVLSAQLKRGIADAFNKFDEYQLAKYDRKSKIRLRDALFLSHAEPKDKEQEGIFKRLAEGNLKTPDTWETNLSAGEDKKETFERLLKEGKLGYMALLRNLRNMNEAGVDKNLVRKAIRDRKGASRVLPFRFVAAARHAPNFEKELDKALIASIEEQEQLPGETVVLVDVSGSMTMPLSGKSDMTAMDAAATLGAIFPAENLRTFTFSTEINEAPPRKGMAGVDAIINNQPHGMTDLGGAINYINKNVPYDRLVVITDEQSHTRVPDPKGRGYMINVASYRNGVGYGKWVHVDGFSESVIKWIKELEAESLA